MIPLIVSNNAILINPARVSAILRLRFFETIYASKADFRRLLNDCIGVLGVPSRWAARDPDYPPHSNG